MYKSPKYKPIQVNSVKDRQKYLKNLHEQVNKSRMAVQTIASFRTAQLSFKKKIDQIQQQLHASVSRINTQSKKNVFLKQLITLMKGQMFNFQKTQKRQEQKNQQQAEKKIKKIQYDVEQILQKHNQQIAKITCLKQNANSGRSQRVVFSNLFKKLQKQIKQTEQLYKQNLMKSQVAKDKQIPIKSHSKSLQRQNYYQQVPKNRLSQTNIDNQPQDSQFLMISNLNDNNAFITNPKNVCFETNQTKRQKKLLNSKDSTHTQGNQTRNSMRRTHQLISVYQNFLQKIKIYIGCQQFDKTIDFYQKIQPNNQKLKIQIDIFNDEILSYQSQINDINQQKKHLECIDKVRQLPLGSLRRIKTKSEHQIALPQSPRNCKDNSILNQVARLMNIPTVKEDQVGQDDLKILDMNLDLLLQQCKNQQDFKGDLSQVNRATTATSQANAVDILLDKMERFSQCQKLLDKNLFKQQYIKEISRNKKHRVKK